MILKKGVKKISYSDFVIPFFICTIIIIGLFKKVDIFNEFIAGAWENIKIGVKILPALIGLIRITSYNVCYTKLLRHIFFCYDNNWSYFFSQLHN